MPLEASHIKSSLVIPSHCGGQSLPGQLEDQLPIVNNNTTLHDRLATEDEPIITGRNKKYIFWQTSIQEHKCKLAVRVNNKMIVGIVDTEDDVTIITQKP